MEELKQFLNENINIDLISIVISGARKKEGISKVKIRPIALKGKIVYQSAVYKGEKVFHGNYGQEELIGKIMEWIETDLKQIQFTSKSQTASILISKKGKATIKTKKQVSETEVQLSHNRKKEYILEEGIAIPFLIDLGVMTSEGLVVKSRYDKFRQINRFLEFIRDILPHLPREREVTILDFGCGKSYLTFAMYYYLKVLKEYNIRVIGLDLKEDVIQKCNQLKDRYGFEKLSFYVGDIASYDGEKKVDMVVSLHACDTATDYALSKAIHYDAKVILSVPCCQHELNGQLENEVLEPILKYGLLQERMASLITDGLRAQLLESQGYSVQILEFIDLEHTPKNILIRAIKTDKIAQNSKELADCMDFLSVQPTLATLLRFKRGQGDI